MFKEFNVKFEDAEIVGGADNLLEGTGVTKVILRGDNKLSSLDSTLKNCSQLDTVDGELDLRGVSDIDGLLEGSNLVKNIDLKNVNNKNITSNNAFPHVNQINIGGEVYNKEAIQTIISSREWTFNHINYLDEIGESIVTHASNISEEDENNQIIINDPLEQKARGIEIKGQTYQNLIQGKEGAELLADIKFESIEGKPSELSPIIDHPISVEVIEGQTYQNLINGKGEYNLTDSYNTTWTENNNTFENMPSMIEIPEIWGNTVQDENDLSNIQSVGDLYIDENGNPILDDEGNEQYKLELESYSDGNLYLNEGELKFQANSNWDVVKDGVNSFTATQKIRQSYLKSMPITLPKGKYTFRYILKDGECDSFNVYLNKKKLTLNNNMVTFVVNELSEFYFEFRNYAEASVSNPYTCSCTFNLVRGDFNEYKNISSNSNKATILLPQPLRRISYATWGKDYYLEDRLRYKEGKYLLDRASEVIHLNKYLNSLGSATNSGSSDFIRYSLGIIVEGYTTEQINALVSLQNTTNYRGITMLTGWGESKDDVYWLTERSYSFTCSSSNNKLAYIIQFLVEKHITRDDLIEMLQDSYIVIGNYKDAFKNSSGNAEVPYFETLETKILENIALETYEPTTYISVNTGVKPSEVQITNKRHLFSPLGIQPNKEYTLQLDAKGTRIVSINNDISFLSNCITSLTNMTVDKININGSAITIDAVNGDKDTYCFMNFNNHFTNINKNNFTFKCDFNILNISTNDYKYIRFQCEQGDDTGYYYEFTPASGKSSITIDYNYTAKKYSIIVKGAINYSCNDVAFSTSQYPKNLFRILTRGCKVKYSNMYLKINDEEVVGGIDEEKTGIKPLTVNLGGVEASIQPTYDGFNHYSMVVRTPSTLTTDKLELFGEGVVVNDVMLFEGGESAIKQEVEYIEGIQSIGELQEDGTYKIEIISLNDIDVPFGKRGRI